MSPKILVVRTYFSKSVVAAYATHTVAQKFTGLDDAEKWMQERWSTVEDTRDVFTVAEVVDWETYKKYRGYEQQARGHA